MAVRATGVFARRLVRARLGADAEPPWQPSGTVLVTGGTGGAGAHAARGLAAAAAPPRPGSRRGAQATGAQALREELEAQGVRVTLAACDVAERDQLARLLAEHPVDAVVHTAGVLDDGVVATLTPDRLETVLRPKLRGALNLHELTEGRDLDAFVLYSSLSGHTGSAAQAGYAAANAFLDALAEHRRHRGLPGTSVAWGALGGGGMAEEEAAAQRVRRGGLRPMSPDRVLRSLRLAVAAGDGVVAVADIDWERFAQGYTAVRPTRLLQEIPEAVAATGAADATRRETGATAQSLAARLAAMPAADRVRAARDLVRAHAAGVLGHAHASDIPEHKAFRELGVDSSPPSSCATSSAPPPACACPPPSSSTTRPPPRSAATSPPSSAATTPPKRPPVPRPPRRTNPSPWSPWPAASPAPSPPRNSSGSCWPPAATP
ncbi:beta-ketoacyl reductase [Actinomadura keratinilytica]